MCPPGTEIYLALGGSTGSPAGCRIWSELEPILLRTGRAGGRLSCKVLVRPLPHERPPLGPPRGAGPGGTVTPLLERDSCGVVGILVNACSGPVAPEPDRGGAGRESAAIGPPLSDAWHAGRPEGPLRKAAGPAGASAASSIGYSPCTEVSAAESDPIGAAESASIGNSVGCRACSACGCC